MSSAPSTSTFAGTCMTQGGVNGDRLTTALFHNPKDLEFDNSTQKMYVLEYSKSKLKVVNLSTGNVETLHTWSFTVYYLKLRSPNVMHYTRSHCVASLDLSTLVDAVTVGSASSGYSLGSLSITRFNVPLRQTATSANEIWLVADFNNDRYL